MFKWYLHMIKINSNLDIMMLYSQSYVKRLHQHINNLETALSARTSTCFLPVHTSSSWMKAYHENEHRRHDGLVDQRERNEHANRLFEMEYLKRHPQCGRLYA